MSKKLIIIASVLVVLAVFLENQQFVTNIVKGWAENIIKDKPSRKISNVHPDALNPDSAKVQKDYLSTTIILEALNHLPDSSLSIRHRTTLNVMMGGTAVKSLRNQGEEISVEKLIEVIQNIERVITIQG